MLELADVVVGFTRLVGGDIFEFKVADRVIGSSLVRVFTEIHPVPLQTGCVLVAGKSTKSVNKVNSR